MTLQQLILKMKGLKELKLTKSDWLRAREDNINLIVGNKMQIEMALEVIKLCDEKIKQFPKEKSLEKKVPLGVN